MKIVYITRTAFGILGGAASYMLPSCMQEYAEILVLSPHPPNLKEKIIFSNNKLNIVNTYSKSLPNHLKKTCDEISKFSPDIIHIFHTQKLLQYVLVLKTKFPSIKIVIDFRSPPIINNKWLLTKTKYMYFLAHTYADCIFTHSLQTISQNLPIRIKKIIELPPGVELSQIPKSTKEITNLLKFVYIGSITENRKIDLLINAFINIIVKSEKSILLDIYGDGDATEKYRNLIRRKNLTKQIVIKSVLPQKELHKRLSNYDAGIAYVYDNLYSKAPSLKSLEYAAAGIPIFASKTIGHKEYCQRFGFEFNLFENTITDISKQILAKRNINKLQQQVLINQNAIHPFDWQYITKNILLTAYRQILE